MWSTSVAPLWATTFDDRMKQPPVHAVNRLRHHVQHLVPVAGNEGLNLGLAQYSANRVAVDAPLVRDLLLVLARRSGGDHARLSRSNDLRAALGAVGLGAANGGGALL